ncbi:MAG: HNH endonuclease [Terriglobales bacterium]
MRSRDWTHEELIVAFNLYCKIPFGQIHIRNPLVIQLAQALSRTPSAVSWKLANFARLDPALKERNISGASHGSKAEVAVFNEFALDWERLSFESEQLLAGMTGRSAILEDENFIFPEGKTRDAITRARVNQGFFRSVVLAAYGSCCCITGCSMPELLNASHIVPWVADVKNRTNPRNGLCLNAVHDRAFDCGLLTITPDLRVKISPKAKRKSSDIGTHELLLRYEHVSISLPRHFAPELKFLRYHNEQVFLKK